MKRVKNSLYYEELLRGEIKGDGSYNDMIELEKLKSSNNDILEKYNPRDFATSIAFEVRRKRLNIIKTAVSICGIFIISLAFHNSWSGGKGTRIKGGENSLFIYSDKTGENKLVNSGEVFTKGDRLQLTYFSTDWKFGTIISKDGNGVVTLHYPGTINEPGHLILNTEAVLPYSYQLDDAKDFEEFYFIVSNSQFSIEEVLDIVDSGDLNLLEDMNLKVINSLEIKKDEL